SSGTQVNTSTLVKRDIDAIDRGIHPDPFSILGSHAQKDGTSVYRVFKPGATAVQLLIGDEVVDMTRISDQGLFETVEKRNEDGAYRIRAHYGDAHSVDSFDAYAFGLLISGYDLQLWGEGNHNKAWKFMGAHTKSIDGVEGTHFVVSAPSASRVSF